ncbi:protein PIN-LIKES 7-like [Canna indica]|uniref:Protein PIN-LIKES 7-like n=1 Tax=Canna indica TaxID=4628 RepID=A0AAQ3L017_9LILI|nr:protein PIN-LIKES 7-like [Canna indica]
MGFWSLFLVASTPCVQVILIGSLGAYLASGYSNILHAVARRDMNKVVFTIFTPSLMFASLSKTVTLQEIISWWFMPVNIGLTFLIGGILGWIAVKILKPPRYLEGLVIATSSAGNLGNLLLIIIPAICAEEGNPFGDKNICGSTGLSYVSFSMALGGFYIWTFAYSLMRNAGKIYHGNQSESSGCIDTNRKNSSIDEDANLVKEDGQGVSKEQENMLPVSVKPVHETEDHQIEIPLISRGNLQGKRVNFWDKIKETLHKIVEELLAPPTIAAIIGFVVGAVPWLKSLFIGASAPLKVIQDSIQLLGDGTVPCITLILGGNLTQGLRKSRIRPVVILAIICVRFVILPLCGIAVVKAAYELGFVTHDPLYRYVLMIQFTVPPAMNIGTMAQLFDVGQEECSVIFLWTYVAAAVALTFWSTIYMWILS